jgi:hypothetical protein
VSEGVKVRTRAITDVIALMDESPIRFEIDSDPLSIVDERDDGTPMYGAMMHVWGLTDAPGDDGGENVSRMMCERELRTLADAATQAADILAKLEVQDE